MHGGYQRTITSNKNRKILSQMNHLTKKALGESWGVEIQASALHVVERYRLIDYEAAREGQIRGLKEHVRLPGGGGDSGLVIDPNYKGEGLQLHFTVEDEGVFTMPWSAIATYRRGLAFWPERVCAENLRATYVGKDSAVPRADKPDF